MSSWLQRQWEDFRVRIKYDVAGFVFFSISGVAAMREAIKQWILETTWYETLGWTIAVYLVVFILAVIIERFLRPFLPQPLAIEFEPTFIEPEAEAQEWGSYPIVIRVRNASSKTIQGIRVFVADMDTNSSRVAINGPVTAELHPFEPNVPTLNPGEFMDYLFLENARRVNVVRPSVRANIPTQVSRIFLPNTSYRVLFRLTATDTQTTGCSLIPL